MYADRHPTLSIMLGTYPKTDALKQQQLESPDFQLEFAPVEVAQKAFKQVVRELKYDVAELAIVTFLQAFAEGKPYVLLPFVMNGNFHHRSIMCRADDALQPDQLAGKRIAGRAYTQTTPTWVRGILSDEYGLKIDSVQWLSQEGPHVAHYTEPSWVKQIDSNLSLEQMLLNGEVDAVLSGQIKGEGIRHLIPKPKETALAWHAKHGVVPINHMVAVRRELAESRPEIVRELYSLLQESRRLAESQGQGLGEGESSKTASGIVFEPSGFSAVRPALEMVMRFAVQQRLIPKSFAPEELYGPVLKALAS